MDYRDIEAVARHFADWQRMQILKHSFDGVVVSADLAENTRGADWDIADEIQCVGGLNLKNGDKIKIAILKWQDIPQEGD